MEYVVVCEPIQTAGRRTTWLWLRQRSSRLDHMSALSRRTNHGRLLVFARRPTSRLPGALCNFHEVYIV